MSIDQWPFYPDSLLEIMGPEKEKREIAKELFQFLQAGCAVALNRSTTIIDAKGDWIRLDPPEFQFTDHCKFFRFSKNPITGECDCPGGNERCLEWDRLKAREVIKEIQSGQFSNESGYYHCHLGLTDIFRPIYIASKPIAIIFSGQFLRHENDEDSEIAKKRIHHKVSLLRKSSEKEENDKLPKASISIEAENKLFQLSENLEILSEEFTQKFISKADQIMEIANEYWLQYKRSMEDRFIDELRDNQAIIIKFQERDEIKDIKTHDDIKDIVTWKLQLICEYLHISWIAFFADWDADGNVLDLEASHGITTKNRTKAPPHFNWNKSNIESISNGKNIIENILNQPVLEKGLRFNTKLKPDEDLKIELKKASIIFPQIRGKQKVRTLFLFGPFQTNIEFLREKKFLESICNLISDDYRHDKRIIKINYKNKQLYEVGDLVSHQIRSILHPLNANVELVTKKFINEIDIADEIVLHYSNNVKHHINHLATYTKMTVGERGISGIESTIEFERNKYKTENISMTIFTLIDSYIPYAYQSKKIRFIKREGLYKEYKAEIVPEYFETAIRNIFDNAIKYAREKTNIYVDMKIDAESIIWASAVEIIIIDYGFGILPNEREEIFKKGVQGTLRGEQIGEGLGLFETSQIIRGHGGSIRCDSNEPESKQEDDWFVKFTIKLPINQDFRSLRNG